MKSGRAGANSVSSSKATLTSQWPHSGIESGLSHQKVWHGDSAAVRVDYPCRGTRSILDCYHCRKHWTKEKTRLTMRLAIDSLLAHLPKRTWKGRGDRI